MNMTKPWNNKINIIILVFDIKSFNKIQIVKENR